MTNFALDKSLIPEHPEREDRIAAAALLTSALHELGGHEAATLGWHLAAIGWDLGTPLPNPFTVIDPEGAPL